MATPFGHAFGGMVQTLFRLDHCAGGKAVLAADILAEVDQIRGAMHRAHDFVELVDPVTVPVRELRHVALREGRLLLRDRVEPKGRIGDDPRAIAARDLAVHFGAVGLASFALDASIFNAFGGGADLALWLQRDALRFQTAMVDPRVDVEFGQALIGDLGPAFAPALDHLGPVPVSDLLAKTALVPIHADLAHGQHDMGVGLGQAVLADVPMHVEIGDHAPIDEFAPSEVAGELDALRLRQFARDGEFDLAGKLGIFADFERLDIVPEPFAVAPRLRRMLRQHHLGMDDAALAGKIVAAIQPLVAQPRGGAVGG